MAGPNGAGKSSLAAKYFAGRVALVNPDAIASELESVASHSRRVPILAGRTALCRQEELLAQREDFAVETTLSGHRELALMRRAHGTGYKVNLIYIGIDSPTTALGRIA